MAKVGKYEILDDLYLTEHGSVSRARCADGGRGLFAIKRFGMPVEDPSEPHWELQTFLDRARVQQMLAAGGARHWTPIHELGIEGGFSYYATDYHPLSAQKLISSGIRIKSNALHSIVLGVAKGLSELKALRNRPHGNLKPSNVLIGGRDLAAAPTLLTDPATNGQAAKVGEAGDLRALGELIHELVLLRLPSPGEWPLPPTASWGALGSRGERWRRLCNDLLNPDPAARPKLPIIAQRLAALRSRRRMRFRKFFATAAVLAFLAVTGIAILSVLDYTARERYRQSQRDWFEKFMTASLDPDRQNRWNADPDLKRILSEVPVAWLRSVDNDPDQIIRWEVYQYREIQAANSIVQTVQDELPGRWELASHAQELQRRMQSRGWTQPAQYLAGLVDAARPAPGADVAAAVDHLLLVSPTIEKGLALANSDWKRFTDRIQMIQGSNDPVLAALARVLIQSASSQVRLTNDAFEPVPWWLAHTWLSSRAELPVDVFVGLDQINRDALLADQLSKILADTFPTNVDRASFDPEVARTIDLKNLKVQDIDQWMMLVHKHTMRHTEAAAAADDLRKRLADVVDLVTHARISPDEVNNFETARHEANLAIAEFEQMKFTQRTIDDKTFENQVNLIRNRIEGLRRFYHPEGPDEWLNALASVATASDAINARWEAWRKVLRDDLPLMMENRKVFQQRQAASEQLRSLLVALDQGFPPAPPLPNPAFMAAGRQRRERELENLLPLIDLGAPALPEEKLKTARADFVQWTANLVTLSQDFPIRKEIIGPADHVDQKWKQKPEFWLDPAIVALVKDDVARLKRVDALESAPRDILVKTLTDKGEAEVALAAWRILGRDTMRPPWPTNKDELGEEFSFRRRVAAALTLLKDPSEADEPTRELADQAPIRWRRFIENATSEQMVLTGWNLAQPFGIDAKEITRLSPVARYDLHLACLREAMNTADDDAIRTDLTALAVAAAALKDRPQVAGLPLRIARISDKEPFADQSPGDLFAVTLPGASRPVQFKRVEPEGGRAFYLCTTDVSVGQFITTMDATGSWPQALELAWPCEAGKTDARRGPRSWEWSGTSASPLTIPQMWLAPQDAVNNNYPDHFRVTRFNRTSLNDAVGGMPSADQPIQYISGQVALFYAAVCGCRLPAPAEWESAYSASEKAVAPAQWNLRDQTWDQQRRYIQEERIREEKKGRHIADADLRWPDEGTFPYPVNASAVGLTATCRQENDGILYFQSVQAPRGNVFHHLVGNVAQFTCDSPEAFVIATDRKTAAAVRKFIEQAPKSLYVIGGSALSPPEVAFDKPLPVARPQDAWADVGIRLAFTAPSRTLSERVKWAIADPPYFWNTSAGK